MHPTIQPLTPTPSSIHTHSIHKCPQSQGRLSLPAPSPVSVLVPLRNSASSHRPAPLSLGSVSALSRSALPAPSALEDGCASSTGHGESEASAKEKAWAAAALRRERRRLTTGEGGGLGWELPAFSSLRLEAVLRGGGGLDGGEAGESHEKVWPARHSHTMLPGLLFCSSNEDFTLGMKPHSWL